jgi:hypothetical protein
MRNTLRVVLAAIAAIMLIGLSTLPPTSSQVDRQTAGPEWPDGG